MLVIVKPGKNPQYLDMYQFSNGAWMLIASKILLENEDTRYRRAVKFCKDHAAVLFPHGKKPGSVKAHKPDRDVWYSVDDDVTVVNTALDFSNSYRIGLKNELETKKLKIQKGLKKRDKIDPLTALRTLRELKQLQGRK